MLEGAPRLWFPNVPCVAAKWRNPEKWDQGEWLQSCFSMGKPISFLLQTARPLTICCCNKRLWHRQKPQSEVRHRNSLQSHFFLHPRAALCHGGRGCARRRSEQALMGSREEGRQIVCCREREGFHKTSRSLGTDEPGTRPPSKACCGLWFF